MTLCYSTVAGRAFERQIKLTTCNSSQQVWRRRFWKKADLRQETIHFQQRFPVPLGVLVVRAEKTMSGAFITDELAVIAQLPRLGAEFLNLGIRHGSVRLSMEYDHRRETAVKVVDWRSFSAAITKAFLIPFVGCINCWIEEDECIRLRANLLVVLWIVKFLEHRRAEGDVTAGGTPAGRDAMWINSQFGCMRADPTDCRLGVGHGFEGAGPLAIENPVVCNYSNHPALSEMYRLWHEFLDRSVRPCTAEEKHNRSSFDRRVMIRWVKYMQTQLCAID